MRLGAESAGVAAAEVPDPLPYDETLPDPVFAVLVGLITSNAEGHLSGDHLRREMARRGKKSRLPADLLASVDRERTSADTARVSLRFRAPMNLPIPYSILWYRPGRMQASAETSFTERALGRLTPDAADARVFFLENGGLAVDIHAWLDKLMGASLDDTDVRTLALVLFRDRWLGVALGRNPSGRPRQGVFDMKADKALFPIPADIRASVRALRGRVVDRSLH